MKMRKGILPLVSAIAVFVFRSREFRQRTDPVRIESWSEEERSHHRFERKVSALNAATSLLTTAATCAAAIFAYNAYIETRRQANVAQKALEISLRPWVYVDKISFISPMLITEDEIYFSARAEVKNYSQLPANSVFLNARAVVYGDRKSDLREDTKSYCKGIRDRNFSFGDIVPSGGTAQTNGVGFDVKLPKPPDFNNYEIGRENAALAIMGCLSYNGPNGTTHQVLMLYHIRRDGSNFIPLHEGTVPIDQLATVLLFMYDGGND